MKIKLNHIAVIICTAIFVLSACREADSPVELYDLKCEFQTNPLGIDRANPLLQWKIADERRSASQTAYQIIVASNLDATNQIENDIWDSGKLESGQSVHIPYKGPELESGKKYFWKVRIWDKDGKMTVWSETSYWEMGLLNNNDWQAKWIARSRDEPGRSVYMRKEIELPEKSIKKARVFVTGLGNYVMNINGKRIGKDLLTPGWTHYPKRLEYQVYDVKQYLASGRNVLGSVLGNMWWSGGLGWKGGQKYSEGPLKFLMQLLVKFEDGTSEVFVSDESWKFSNSPIWADHIYDGEKFDANLEQQGWDKPGFDDSAWLQAEPAEYEGMLVGPRAPSLREQMEKIPVALKEPIPDEYVFDMGQNIVGWAKFRINAPKGDTIKFRFAELLHEDGTVAQENLRTAKATDIVVSNGKEIVWEPKFTYHGFRYVQVSGLKAKPAIFDVVGKVIHTDQPFIGNFECSNDLINSINRNVTWGQRGNFYPAPTDCPQRDERLGWMGDAQIFAPTANFNMNLNRYWAKWMFDITDGQEEEGWVYDVNPPIVVGGPSKPGWGDAIIVIPWMTYQYFGDTRIIEDNFEGMKAWVDYMTSKSKNDIYVWQETTRNDWFGYGDWIAVDPSPSKPIGTAYYYYSTKLLSKMAAVVGKEEDANKYEELSNKIADAYQKEYWNDKELNYDGATQTANLLPLAFGITPEGLVDRVVQNLVEDVIAHDVHPTTGFLGTGFILPMLSKYNHHNLAYEMIKKTDYPSWGYMVKQGATSIWELWNSDSEPPERMNSRNHFALGCVGEWLWNTLAGVNICEHHAGFKRIIIKPQPVGDLKWAKAEYETNYGKILVDWKVVGESFKLNLTVPPNTTAVVEMPELKDGAVVKENGVNIESEDIEGLSRTQCGKILAAAGSYNFIVE